MLFLVTVATSLVMALFLPIFSLDEVSTWSVVAATFGCALLATFHAAIAFAAGGLGARRGAAVSASACVLVVGYVLGFLTPIVEQLRWLRKFSPWFWALGEQPVSNGLDAGRLAILIAATVALNATVAAVIDHRDIRPA